MKESYPDDIVALVRELAGRGLTATEIAAQIKGFTRQTVRRIGGKYDIPITGCTHNKPRKRPRLGGIQKGQTQPDTTPAAALPRLFPVSKISAMSPGVTDPRYGTG